MREQPNHIPVSLEGKREKFFSLERFWKQHTALEVGSDRASIGEAHTLYNLNCKVVQLNGGGRLGTRRNH